jgi:hypothetical protein
MEMHGEECQEIPAPSVLNFLHSNKQFFKKLGFITLRRCVRKIFPPMNVNMEFIFIFTIPYCVVFSKGSLIRARDCCAAAKSIK